MSLNLTVMHATECDPLMHGRWPNAIDQVPREATRTFRVAIPKIDGRLFDVSIRFASGQSRSMLGFANQ